MNFNDGVLAFTFTLPLSLNDRILAKRLSQQSSQPKSERIYLNSLAISAVNFYLQCMGMETDLTRSDSHNPIVLKFMDVSDLYVKGLGKLECRPIIGEATMLEIPLEACPDRIGYVAVRVDESRKQANILGFIKKATIAANSGGIVQIPLQELRSLAEFPEYLQSFCH